MHLWGTTSQQVNERRVEGHDGIAHVYHLLLIITISRPDSGKSGELKQKRGGASFFFKGIRAMIQGEGDQQLILRVSPQH